MGLTSGAKPWQVRDYGKTGVVLDAMASNWSIDPHSSMAWSHLGLNSSTSDMDVYAEKVKPHLHFAGEATCRMLYGSVHAAIASALRAVHEIIGKSAKEDSSWPLFDPEVRRACTNSPPQFTATKTEHRMRKQRAKRGGG